MKNKEVQIKITREGSVGWFIKVGDKTLWFKTLESVFNWLRISEIKI